MARLSSALHSGLIVSLALLLASGTTPVYAQELVAMSEEPYYEQNYREYAPYSAERLDQLLAPIALYPDPLIDHILQASSHPLEIIQAYRWVNEPENVLLQDEQLNSALESKDWDDSVKALAAFPQVLKTLNDNIEWTEQLGKVYATQYDGVMLSVQRLRQLAMASGTLTSTPQQTVTTQNESVYIQPTDPNVLYVPYYNPQYIYGYWPYADYPPYYFAGYAYTRPYVVFSPGIMVVRLAHFNHHHKQRPLHVSLHRWADSPRVNDRNRMTTGNQRFTATSEPPVASAPVPARVFRDGAFVPFEFSDADKAAERRDWRRERYLDHRRPESISSENTIRIMDPARSRQAITVTAEPRTVMPEPRAVSVEQTANQNVIVRRGRAHMEERMREAARVSVPVAQPTPSRSAPVFEPRSDQQPEARTNFPSPAAQQRNERRTDAFTRHRMERRDEFRDRSRISSGNNDRGARLGGDRYRR